MGELAGAGNLPKNTYHLRADSWITALLINLRPHWCEWAGGAVDQLKQIFAEDHACYGAFGPLPLYF